MFENTPAAGSRQPELEDGFAVLVGPAQPEDLDEVAGQRHRVVDDSGRAAAVIRRTRTDRDPHIRFDPQGRPGVASLLATAALCARLAPATTAAQAGGSDCAGLKGLTI